ncbi:hypothetical protein EDD21DRAFT_377629 [Dissophora ornata]|nr:hypothetical protein BGZ58_000176 [Dissophora ornata]KAI8600283.1 hypothetical protein EDD21DRAFT_377629 [Dissophora ornata]
MASADEILSIVAAVLFAALLGQFSTRFLRSHWIPYLLIIFFCTIRVAGYGIRAYLDTNSLEYGSNTWISLYIAELVLLSIGAIFILLLLARLYRSILPKLRAQTGEDRGKFERTLVDHTRLYLLPVIVCVIIGGTYAAPTYSESQQNTGLILRKIGVVMLGFVGFLYLVTALMYRKRYPDNQQAFNIALIVTALFDVSLVYKIVYTFYSKAQTTTVAYFILSPLLEIIALCVLSVDLQGHFLGHPSLEDTKV